ncbi:MAG: hypothetical protein ACM3RX_01840, partial [Methanococcaceae archaeon]
MRKENKFVSHKRDESENVKNEAVKTEPQASFTSILNKLAGQETAAAGREIEPFAQLDYQQELKFKNEALRRFWDMYSLSPAPAKIIPSPKERHYRTTTKRRVVSYEGKYYLLFHDDNKPVMENEFHTSLLEPDGHNNLYRFLQQRMNEPSGAFIARSMNYFIIKGSYKEFSIIFNVHTLTGSLINKLKDLAGELKKAEPRIISAFVYYDPTRSEYYLESNRPDSGVTFKKLFGPDKLFVNFEGLKYSFSPLSFSQVNESMVPVMLKQIKEMLSHEGSKRLVDLYCGYGLFTLYLADMFSESVGVEMEGSSVKSAIDNNSFMKRPRVKFLPRKITEEVIQE